MPLTEKQLDYLSNCDRRWNVKTGATGSGKSYVDIAVTIPKRIMALRGEGLCVLMGNTRGTLERNILDPMREIWPRLVGNIRADNTVMLFGKKVYALGADNKKHVARIQGATFEYVYGDEITTWSEDVFQMLKSRLRCQHSHFDGTCNPANPNHWFKKFLDSDADIYQQSYTIDDGALPANVVAELKKEYAGTVYYKRYIRGEWAAADGLCYQQFADNPSKWMRDEAEPNIDFISVGVDFGGNRSLTTFVATAFHGNFQRIGILKDHHITGVKGSIDADRVNAEFVRFIRELQAEYSAPVKYCFADSEAQYLINGLAKACKREGLTIQIGDCAKSAIVQRIVCMNTLLNTDRVYFLRRCPLVIDGMRNAAWDADAAAKGKDVRVDNFSSDIDIIDAMEYSFSRFIGRLAPVR